MRSTLIFILGLVLLQSIGCGQKETKNDSKPPARADNAILAPDFTLARTNGELVSLSSMKGKVVLLNFWGTWCGPCRVEIPDFVKLHDKYNSQGLEIVGVTLTSGSPSNIENFVKEWGMNYNILTDVEGNETQLVTEAYGRAVGKPISGIPTTFIIDREGYIVKGYLGPRSEDVFYNDLKPYL